MADTLENTILGAGVWVDLYADTGLAVGTQVVVNNLGTSTVLLHTGLAEPIKTSGFVKLLPGDSLTNTTSASGAWAHSVFKSGLVNVAEV